MLDVNFIPITITDVDTLANLNSTLNLAFADLLLSINGEILPDSTSRLPES
jgi:hypothetical protein